jgi:hypothetical protein
MSNTFKEVPLAVPKTPKIYSNTTAKAIMPTNKIIIIFIDKPCDFFPKFIRLSKEDR